MRRTAFFAWIAFFAPSVAFGQISLLDEEQRLRSKQPPNISTDLLDPEGLTRLHLTTRFTFSNGDEVFSDDALTTFALQAFLRLQRGLAVQAALPFGLVIPSGSTNEFVTGNLRIGAAAGFDIRLQPENRDVRSARLKLGAGLDVYIPTAGTPDGLGPLVGEAFVAALRAMHSFEPELFIDDAMLFRLRAHAQLSLDYLIFEAEMGMSPGFTLEGDSVAQFLISWAARISAKPTYIFDPYIEAGSSFHVAGQSDPDLAVGSIGRDFTTPVWITTGVRLHFLQVDPALFVSVNLDETAIMFGIDLAGAARELVRLRDDDNFLESFD